MARRILWLVMVWLLAASPVCAQILPIPPAPRDVLDDWAPTVPPFPTRAIWEAPEGYVPDAFTFWARTEYLLGWVRGTPMQLPLATADSSTKDKVPGAIGQKGTVVLMGNSNTFFRTLSGMRFTAGAWLNQGNTIGVQVTGYVQEVGVTNFQALSNSTGAPLYGVPYASVTPKGTTEAVVLISNPKKLAGYINTQSSLQRWGEDASGLWCFYREPGLAFTAIVGGRHEDLFENFNLQAVSFPVASGVAKSIEDRFTTRNQFFGAQVGGNVFVQKGAFILDTTFKLGLGQTYQYIEIQGASSQLSGTKLTAFPGGIFAQPSNSGHFTGNLFTAMPILETKLGYQFTPRLRTFIGYDFLYWNGVVRPGNQIDRNINVSQDPILGATKGVEVGPTAPNPRFIRSGFWAQDINVGIDFRF